MTNEQKYKTAKERVDAFNEWCFNRDCESCELKSHNFDGGGGCKFYWLAIEAEERLKPCPCSAVQLSWVHWFIGMLFGQGSGNRRV